MSKFKVGQRVKYTGPGSSLHNQVGVIRVAVDQDCIGVEFDNNMDGHTLDGNAKNGHGWWTESENLELVVKTLDNLDVDDVIVNDSGDEYTIAGIAGNAVFLADEDGHATYARRSGFSDHCFVTIKELKDNDCAVKGTDDDDIEEVTLEEIAEAMDIDVKKLRIKEGK